MIRSLYTATSAMMAQGVGELDMIANNLANTATPGYRAQHIHATSLASADGRTPSDVQVDPVVSWEDPRPGDITQTGEELDLAIEGDGFLVVEGGDGVTGYTRNGRLRMDGEGNLLDRLGNSVMGQRGEINLPETVSEITIDRNGTVFADGVRVDRLRIVEFPADSSPVPVGGGLYVPSAGEPQDSNLTVTQGFFIRSNVSAIEQMVKMIETSRSVEAYQKVILATSDDTTATLVRQTGRVG